MKKFLYITHLSGKYFNRFWESAFIAAKNLGYEIHIACNMKDAVHPDWEVACEKWSLFPHQIDFERNPFSCKNFRAKKQLDALLNEEKFDIVHCNTPIGGVVGRLSAHKNKVPYVVYQAHGFHFYKDGPLINWIFYPAEWVLSYFCDALVTINKEDYVLAKKHFKKPTVYYTPGVGIHSEYYEHHTIDRDAVRERLGIGPTDFFLLSVGELQDRKNHKIVLDAIRSIGDSTIIYCIAGVGENYNRYEEFILKNNLTNVKLLGYRSDIDDLCKACDCFVHPSVREGLGIAPLEAMAAGCPLIAANINGIKDYTIDGVTGKSVDPHSVMEMRDAILHMKNNPQLLKQYSYANISMAKKFDILRSIELLTSVYVNY